MAALCTLTLWARLPIMPRATPPTRLLTIVAVIGALLLVVFLGPRIVEHGAPPSTALCPDTVAGAALVLEVWDAATGARLPTVAGGARRVVSDPPGGPPLAFPWEASGAYWLAGGQRAGVYAVTVTAPGYLPWDSAGIRVPPAPCGPRGQKLDVRLHPQP